MSVRKGTGSIGAQETHQPEAKQSPSRQNSPRGKYRGSPEQGGTAGAPHHVCRCVPRGYATAHGEVGVGMGEYQTVPKPNRTAESGKTNERGEFGDAYSGCSGSLFRASVNVMFCHSTHKKTLTYHAPRIFATFP